eukprot:365907-Chlamydomonas_euryale.AAC.10
MLKRRALLQMVVAAGEKPGGWVGCWKAGSCINITAGRATQPHSIAAHGQKAMRSYSKGQFQGSQDTILP